MNDRRLAVFVDANILFSRVLRDYVLYSAGSPELRPFWSQGVLDEMSRNLNRARPGVDTEVLVNRMNESFRYSLVVPSAESIDRVAVTATDPKDRHVLAAALSARADILVTENDKDFPRAWMSENGIELHTAGSYLIWLSRNLPHVLIKAHEMTVKFLPGKSDDARVLLLLDRAIGDRHRDAVLAVARAVGAADVFEQTERLLEETISPQQFATVSTCGFFMPRAKKSCVLAPNHRGHHRSKVRAGR